MESVTPLPVPVEPGLGLRLATSATSLHFHCNSIATLYYIPIIMMSQNRQAAKDRLKADIEYDVNLKAELEIANLHRKLDRLTAEVLARLDGSRGTS